MRGEIVTRSDRRRRWSQEEKISILNEAFAPRAVVTEVARRHEIQPQQIYQWRDRVLEERKANVIGEVGEFVPIELAPAPMAGAPPQAMAACGAASLASTPATNDTYSVEFVLAGGRIMRVATSSSWEQLRSLIRAVEGA